MHYCKIRFMVQIKFILKNYSIYIVFTKMSKNIRTGHSLYTITNYEDAIKKLRDLQSNVTYLNSVIKNPLVNSTTKLKDTEKYLLRSGISLEQLDNLSIIHVAGTKGKGSVCAFTEAILREHGFRTGFFSSPHLVSVRERIRINGCPMSQTDFAFYFSELYRKLEDAKEFESDMPMYFKFLTVLMFNVFLNENIDVAIIEVGIGGEFDCTNIIRNPVCVGITNLGLDHTFLLGNTIEEIAFQKSGIFKPNTTAFTLPQPKEALQVLKERAIEKKCTLHVIPPFQSYEWGNKLLSYKMLSEIQQQNASLAVQLAVEWIKFRTNEKHSSPINNSIYNKKCCSSFYENTEANVKKIHFGRQDKKYNMENVSDEKLTAALSSCVWPGRQQILKGTSIDFYLDGAHTLESIDCCISWFNSHIEKKAGKRYLIFNITGQRDTSRFLTLLKSVKFHRVYFVPNLSGIPDIDDQTNITFIDKQIPRCQQHCEIWGEGSTVANNVMEILCNIKTEYGNKEPIACKDRAQVLITGSLHLVGAALAILDPDLTMSTTF
ncbi:hypothetical protein KPH14_011562 [Odynerus spinipes]|uniref:Folylpolyglutamate synthase n=1 Tax=Odynerus spinipes TaxID=1348599 RepID=A0AAD9VMW2_9HYME|nr:hypothetical protein KPH14_011562 [Odynerus spinipes]